MIVKIRKYNAEGYQEDGAHMPVTFIEAVIIPDNPELNAEMTLGRLFFSEKMLEEFCSVVTVELEEDYVRS